MRLALKFSIQNDRKFVDVILLYLTASKGHSSKKCIARAFFINETCINVSKITN